MNTPLQIRFTIALSLLTSFSFGQSLNIDKIYDFSPHKLTKAEQQRKFPSLDSLWNKVRSDTAKYLPLLRGELNALWHYATTQIVDKWSPSAHSQPNKIVPIRGKTKIAF
jgi:hypothetical protein